MDLSEYWLKEAERESNCPYQRYTIYVFPRVLSVRQWTSDLTKKNRLPSRCLFFLVPPVGLDMHYPFYYCDIQIRFQ